MTLAESIATYTEKARRYPLLGFDWTMDKGSRPPHPHVVEEAVWFLNRATPKCRRVFTAPGGDGSILVLFHLEDGLVVDMDIEPDGIHGSIMCYYRADKELEWVGSWDDDEEEPTMTLDEIEPILETLLSYEEND